MLKNKYDIIVVGGGHAGCEAAAAAANMGSTVLLITSNMESIARMSCNPAIGGVAKGQIVREIDALGGYTAKISDQSTIQFRMLNKSKGPAMWSPRSQNDRWLFSRYWRIQLENIFNVSFMQDTVKSLILENNKLKGVNTSTGEKVFSKSVIITSGTFLGGKIHIGKTNFTGGRMGEKAVEGITEQLINLGFESGRMKTGTPPRVDGRSLDYSVMEEQEGDWDLKERFSFDETSLLQKQRSCFITYTNPDVHEVLKTGFKDSPLFDGSIAGVGPRYCPSIEDKINKFAQRDRHQIFVEPEGWDTVEVYVNGFSTSLNQDIQKKALRLVKGFENVKFFRPGYAIEYDYFPPTQLLSTLETKPIKNLYFAGQINGTTGYEEAACQGLMAGINAHLKLTNQKPFILKRNEAYIGVLIDDLINKGTDEPYRMFTSRAEFRISLRQDNADERLTQLSYDIGLANKDALKKVKNKINSKSLILSEITKYRIKPEEINEYLIKVGSKPLSQSTPLEKVLLRPEIKIDIFRNLNIKGIKIFDQFNPLYLEYALIEHKYKSYIIKETQRAQKMVDLEQYIIQENFNYSSIVALSNESREKLNNIRPTTIGQASRISGVSPADISVLLIHFGR